MAERTLTQSEIYSARPTVHVDGRVNTRLSALVSEMRMTEREGGLSALEIVLENQVSQRDGDAVQAFEDEQIVKLGTDLKVSTGDEDAPTEIFRGRVTGLEVSFGDERASRVVVLAEDAFQRARMARATKVHDDFQVGTFVQSLAGRYGLRSTVSGFDGSLGVQVQFNESDLAFVRRVVASRDGDLQVVADEIQVSRRPNVQRGTVELELHGQLRQARVTADLAHQVTEVTVGGWNAQQGARVSGSSRGNNLGPGSGRTGASELERAFSARSEHWAEVPPTTDDEARAMADTAFARRARRFVCLEGTADGNPALRVGTHVEIRGLSARFDNTYYVVRASHRYDLMKGYQTDFEAECAYLGEAS